MYDIQLATTNEDIASTFTVMRQLRTHLNEQAYVPLITEIQKNVGYLLAVLRDPAQVRAVAGFRITTSLAWGHYLYVDDLSAMRLYAQPGMARLCLAGWPPTASSGAVRSCTSILGCSVTRRTGSICASGWTLPVITFAAS